jgi:polynucleotide 5'-hydroxyl-kinase GRC3/NOL9
VLSHHPGSDGTVPESMRPQIPDRVRSHLSSECAVVLLQDLRSGVEGLGRVCQTFDSMFGRLRKPPAGSNGVLCLDGASLVCQPHVSMGRPYLTHSQLTHVERDTQPFLLPSSWETALSAIAPSDEKGFPDDSKSIVCLVQGPKKSGKSTFARTLVNRLCMRSLPFFVPFIQSLIGYWHIV